MNPKRGRSAYPFNSRSKQLNLNFFKKILYMYFFVCLFYFSCDVIAAMMDDISKRCPNNVASSVGASNMAAMPLSFESLGIGGKPSIF